MREFVCENCGEKFETKAYHAKYCAECRVEINRKRSRENEKKRHEIYCDLKDLKCEICGEEFIGKPGVKYCSRECKIIGMKKKRVKADKNFEQFCEENRDDYLFYMREYFLKNHKKFINNMHNYARWQMKKLMKKSVEK